MRYCSGSRSERLGQQAAGLLAFAVVGVAAVERAARQAVEAHHQLSSAAAAVLRPVLAHCLASAAM